MTAKTHKAFAKKPKSNYHLPPELEQIRQGVLLGDGNGNADPLSQQAYWDALMERGFRERLRMLPNVTDLAVHCRYEKHKYNNRRKVQQEIFRVHWDAMFVIHSGCAPTYTGFKYETLLGLTGGCSPIFFYRPGNGKGGFQARPAVYSRVFIKGFPA